HRRPVQRLGELEGQRDRVVAVGAALGSLNDDGRQRVPGRPAADRGDRLPDRLIDDRRWRPGRRRDQGCVPSVTWSVWVFPPRWTATETLVPGAYWRRTSLSGC